MIAVLGAGHSSPYLVRHLLEVARQRDTRLVLVDRDADLAASRVGGHPAGEAHSVDVEDEGALWGILTESRVVVDLMPARFLPSVARLCVAAGRPLVSVSYLDAETRRLDGEARARGVLVLTETGLDPGIDLMSSVELLGEARSEGCTIRGFESYGGGLPSRREVNPVSYAITWNPGNVVMAGTSGVQYRRGGRLRLVPWNRVFADTWRVDVPGVGALDAYANRNSLKYENVFDLGEAQTLVRGTLRYPGWTDLWRAVVVLGLPNEALEIEGLPDWPWSRLTSGFLPPETPGRNLREQCRSFLGPSFEPEILESVLDRLEWLGLLGNEVVGGSAFTPAEALVALLSRRLALPPGEADLVVLHHRLDVTTAEGRNETWTSTLVERGEPGGTTAMARTVGLPAALVVELILDGRLDLAGCRLPTDPRIAGPLLAALAEHGVAFEERREGRRQFRGAESHRGSSG